MTVKIPLPNTADLSKELQERLGASPINVTRMMANAPVSLAGFQEFAGSILFQSEFDPRKREIAVLRVAHATKADYEWTHHVRVGKSLGVTDEQVDAIATENPVTSLDEEANLLCRVADEISLDVRLSDDALSQILDRYGIRGATELILCISYFNMVSRFLESTRVEFEEGVIPRFLK
jgi:4-carboxymuconolactone decarboxylase